MIRDEAINELLGQWRVEGSKYFCKDGGDDNEKEIAYFAKQIRKYCIDEKDMERKTNALFQHYENKKKNPGIPEFRAFVKNRFQEDEKRERVSSEDLCYWCGGTRRLPGVILFDKIENKDVFPEDFFPGYPYSPKTRWTFHKHYFPCVCVDPDGEQIEYPYDKFRQMHMSWYKKAKEAKWDFCPEGLSMGVQLALHDYLRRLQQNDWTDPDQEEVEEPEQEGEELMKDPFDLNDEPKEAKQVGEVSPGQLSK